MQTLTSTIKILSTAAACAIASLLVSADAASATNHRVVRNDIKPYSIYCVDGQKTYAGWEKNLVHKNPSLANFHWSPIPGARRGNIVVGNAHAAKAAPFHYVKPQVMPTVVKAPAATPPAFGGASSSSSSAASTSTSISATMSSQNTDAALYNSGTSAQIAGYGDYAPVAHRATASATSRNSQLSVKGRVAGYSAY